MGDKVGFDANLLRTSANLYSAGGVDISRPQGHYKLVSTQTHHGIRQIKDADSAQIDRKLVRVGTQEEFLKHPEFAKHMVEETPSSLTLYSDWDYSKGYAWGMVIDLNACIGCNACTIACQA